jgi:hypothetical protein
LEIIIVINGWWEAERIEIDAGEVIPHTEERGARPQLGLFVKKVGLQTT